MSGGISAPFIRRPIATTLLMAGGLARRHCRLPSLAGRAAAADRFSDHPGQRVAAGRLPETMASSVAQPLERQIAQIPGVSQMTSTSSLGVTAISVQFDLDRNIDAAAKDIQAAINAAAGQLPKDLPTPPTYRKVNPSDPPILILSVLRTSRRSPRSTTPPKTFSRSVSARSGRFAGAHRRPAEAGDPHPGRSGQAGREEPAARRRALADRDRHVDSPKGSINGAKHSFTIYDNDQFTDAKPWNDVIIAYRNGAPVRVRDIGVAVAGPSNDAGGVEQRQAQRLPRDVQAARRQRHQDGPEHQAGAGQAGGVDPADIHVAITSDRTTTIRASVDDVQFTLC